MVRFEKFKKWHTQESKPVLQGGLDPIFVRPRVLLSVSGGRTGSIWNTALTLPCGHPTIMDIFPGPNQFSIYNPVYSMWTELVWTPVN